MRGTENALRTAEGQHRETPRPPSNLWEQLDALRAEAISPPIPEGSFTVEDYQKRYGITIHVARKQVRKLLDAGKLKVIRPHKNGPSYYVLL